MLRSIHHAAIICSDYAVSKRLARPSASSARRALPGITAVTSSTWRCRTAGRSSCSPFPMRRRVLRGRKRRGCGIWRLRWTTQPPARLNWRRRAWPWSRSGSTSTRAAALPSLPIRTACRWSCTKRHRASSAAGPSWRSWKRDHLVSSGRPRLGCRLEEIAVIRSMRIEQNRDVGAGVVPGAIGTGGRATGLSGGHGAAGRLQPGAEHFLHEPQITELQGCLDAVRDGQSKRDWLLYRHIFRRDRFKGFSGHIRYQCGYSEQRFSSWHDGPRYNKPYLIGVNDNAELRVVRTPSQAQCMTQLRAAGGAAGSELLCHGQPGTAALNRSRPASRPGGTPCISPAGNCPAPARRRRRSGSRR